MAGFVLLHSFRCRLLASSSRHSIWFVLEKMALPWFGVKSSKTVAVSAFSDGVALKEPKQVPYFNLKFFGCSILSFIPWNINSSNKVQMPTTVKKVALPWFGLSSRKTLVTSAFSEDIALKESKQLPSFDFKFLGYSIISFFPWKINSSNKIQMPTTVNKELKRHSQPHVAAKTLNQYPAVRFRPYVSKVPWHTGVRAVLSQIFPRYGHYCGPNWSSGKAGGSHVWDKRPIDWLDFCCYCHDIGYDSHSQAELLKADLAFLECLEKSNMGIKGNPLVAHAYKTMCISGLKNVLIPYRHQLLNLQAAPPAINFGWIGDWKMKAFSARKDFKIDLSLAGKGWQQIFNRNG